MDSKRTPKWKVGDVLGYHGRKSARALTVTGVRERGMEFEYQLNDVKWWRLWELEEFLEGVPKSEKEHLERYGKKPESSPKNEPSGDGAARVETS